MRVFTSILLLFIIACNTKQGKKTIQSTTLSDTHAEVSDKTVSDSLITGERIDRPANIRDTINGKLSFVLNDNTIVTSTEEKDKWLQVGVLIDLSQKEKDCLCLLKGAKILAEGKEVGQAVEKIQLNSAFKSNDGLKGEITGYTSVLNIKSNTIPENVFSNIINISANVLTIKDFKQFISDFKFSESTNCLIGLKCFQIDENWIDDPSPMLRLLLLFNGDRFYGAFHSRPLMLKQAKTIKVKRGFYLSTFNLDDKRIQDLVTAFNSYIVQVD